MPIRKMIIEIVPVVTAKPGSVINNKMKTMMMRIMMMKITMTMMRTTMRKAAGIQEEIMEI